MNQRNRILFLLSVLVLLSVACNIGGRSTPVPVTAMPDLPKTEETKDPEPTLEPTTEPTATQPPPTTVPKNKASTIEVTNASGRDIQYIYIAASDDEDWGDDWLDGIVLADGDTHQFTNIPDGVYDMQANDLDNYIVHEIYDIEVKGTFAWTIELDVSLIGII